MSGFNAKRILRFGWLLLKPLAEGMAGLLFIPAAILAAIALAILEIWEESK